MKKNVEPYYMNSPLNNPMINYKVYKIDKIENIFFRIVFFVLGGFVGLIFFSGLFKIDGYATIKTYISDIVVFIGFGLFAMKFLMNMYVKRATEKQQNKLKNQFRDMLESLTSSLSSGSNVNMAFEAALNDLSMQYTEKDFIIIEMREIINGLGQNIPIEAMLRNFGNRSGNEDIESFADIFEVCYRNGGDMRLVINRTHSLITEKIAVSDEIETKLTSNKMQHNIMSIMPIAVVALLKLTNQSFATNFTTPIGVIVNIIAIGVFVGAYKYGQKIVDIKG